MFRCHTRHKGHNVKENRACLCYHIAQSLSSLGFSLKTIHSKQVGIIAAKSLTTKKNTILKQHPQLPRWFWWSTSPYYFKSWVASILGICHVGPKGDLVKESVSHVENLSVERWNNKKSTFWGWRSGNSSLHLEYLHSQRQ